MLQLGQDGNPKGGLVECLCAIFGAFGGQFRRLEPFHFAYAVHRGDA
jgi:hypothetical protein